ncbi:domain found in IF2B/IF5 [Pyronema domesticum]|uniref:Similar to Probable eukaryotic translation initiation factor 2 subunit beta acc. no. P56329 n=1 Tax=Pyronema omphalodes (strain CBS 100304) TaxID=1076935 RepID=U4LCE2_PYROM|nr:domain found in IF2B/IF5 [Pyronema domesticum]CCX29533.1 Similar to Probable eukaryotic translation initiation factor 2 subunit beta; acc. no. P56329 [Pyronema omphalodes CBS 100304]
MAETEELVILPSAPKKAVTFDDEENVDATNTQEAAADEGDGLLDLKKKKKKSSAAVGSDGLLDLKKKKKKKVEAKAEDESTEDKKADGDAPSEEVAATSSEVQFDADELANGTGVWNSAATSDLTYPLLLSRFFTLLKSQHPDLTGDGRRNYKIPPPQVMREGNKKSIFANISDICKRMKRSDEHVTAFLFAELGTSGSVDGAKRLVIRGKFQQKQLENVLRRYILEYVTCRTCKSPDTDLKKGENRLFFVTCNSCGSRRSVAAIKTGFQATVGKRRRQKV